MIYDQRLVLDWLRRSLAQPLEMVGVMVAIDSIEHLDAHPQKARCLPFVYAGLHQPGRRCVAQRVRCNFARQLASRHRRLEARSSPMNRLPVPFDKMLLAMPLACHRRKWAKSRGGIGTGGCRFLVARVPSASR